MNKTKEQIIEETVSYYDYDNRGVDAIGNCSYITSSNEMCAIGRCLKNPISFIDMHNSVDILIERFGDNIFKEEYRGHELPFWMELQRLHDNGANWDSNGLSPIGKQELCSIREFFLTT